MSARLSPPAPSDLPPTLCCVDSITAHLLGDTELGAVVLEHRRAAVHLLDLEGVVRAAERGNRLREEEEGR